VISFDARRPRRRGGLTDFSREKNKSETWHISLRFDASMSVGQLCRRQPPFAEGLEDAMSRESISIVVTIVVIALMFAWVPLVNIVCPPGWSSAEKESSEEKEPEKRKQGQSLQREPSAEASPQNAAPVSRLSSRRLRDQSRDLCEAISARGQRGGARSESTS
jgi:hypothetical protein